MVAFTLFTRIEMKTETLYPQVVIEGQKYLFSLFVPSAEDEQMHFQRFVKLNMLDSKTRQLKEYETTLDTLAAWSAQPPKIYKEVEVPVKAKKENDVDAEGPIETKTEWKFVPIGEGDAGDVLKQHFGEITNLRYRALTGLLLSFRREINPEVTFLQPSDV